MEGPARSLRWLPLLLLLVYACDRGPVDARPSIVLVVVDTLRADAVSAYGEVEGTTPHIDALAREGVRYANVFAPSPWTLPSHATLLTGLPPEAHGVGVAGRVELAEELVTLAERLSDAGYDTLGISENSLVSRYTRFNQGFDHFRSELYLDDLESRGIDMGDFDVVESIEGWAAARSSRAPFFLLVNLYGVHSPYDYEEAHDFLPAHVTPGEAREFFTGRRGVGIAEALGMCDRLPGARSLEITRALYLGGVAAVDAQLRRVLDAVQPALADGPLITVVTSDHGEHLGEHRLLGHEFSVYDPVLRVPLVVHGVPGAQPGVVEHPLGLADLHDALLHWAGQPQGRALPLPDEAADPEPVALQAFFSDAEWEGGEDGPRVADGGDRDARRRGCSEADRVFGDMVSVFDGRFKLVWFEKAPLQLFDMSWDAAERSDVAAHNPEAVERLGALAEPLRRRLAEATPAGAPDPEAEEALRALGYVE